MTLFVGSHFLAHRRGKANLVQILRNRPAATLKSIEIDRGGRSVIVSDKVAVDYLVAMFRTAVNGRVVRPGKQGHSHLAVFTFDDGTNVQCTIAPFRTGDGLEIFIFVSEFDPDATEFQVEFAEPIPEVLREACRRATEDDLYREGPETGKKYDAPKH